MYKIIGENIYTIPTVQRMFQIVYCRLADFFFQYIYKYIYPHGLMSEQRY